EQLYQFYAQRIPSHIYSQPAFEKWVQATRKQAPEQIQALFLSQEQLLKQRVDDELADAFPDQIVLKNRIKIGLDYHFSPGQARDGVEFKIPLAQLNLLNPQNFEWLTPGLLKEKVACYLKALPKTLRKQFVPVPDYAEQVLTDLNPQLSEQGRPLDFLTQLIWALNRRATHKVSRENFAEVALPDYLRPFFILQDVKGKTLAENDDLMVLKAQYHHLVEAQIEKHQAKRQQPAQGLTQWDFGDLPKQETLLEKGVKMVAYPALVVEANKICLRLLGDEHLAEQEHRQGVLALLRLQLADKEKYLQQKLNLHRACLCYAPYGTCQALTAEVIERALVNVIEQAEQIRTQAAFEAALLTLRAQWVEQAQALANLVTEILTAHQSIAKQVNGKVNPRWLASLPDIQQQLEALIEPGFVLRTPPQWLTELPRYLQALQKRLEKMDQDPNKDLQSQAKLKPLLELYQRYAADSTYVQHQGLIEIRWLLEELRISLFSQPMKTRQPVSIVRLEQRLKAL
ncbi:MAG: DUF3418 domain-containing protein, partial [Thiotrichales bacterium]|nr:DUF3418 domain-containing protein [Thiotrichales bacterium]